MDFNHQVCHTDSPKDEGEKHFKQKAALIQMLEILHPCIKQGIRMTVLFVLLGTMGFSQSYWVKYGWQVFNNAGDARILSLGGAAVTDFGTSVSPLFNPAASGKVGIHNLNYTHQSRLAGMINSDLLGFPIQNFSRPLNLIIIHEGIDQIPDTRNILLDFGLDGVPGTGDIGEGNGTLDEGERLDEDKVKYFSQRQLGLHLSTSWKNNNIEFGIAVKTLFHSIGEHTGSGIGLDFGVLAIPWKNGRLGLTIRDITTSWQVWENGTVERFKPSVMTGISHSHQFSNFPVSISGMVNIVSDGGGKSIDDDINLGNHGANIRFGFNGVYDNKIALRLGRNTIGSTTGGIGLSWDNLSLDYAFLNEPTGSGLGVSHMVSLSINYGWIRGMIDRL